MSAAPGMRGRRGGRGVRLVGCLAVAAVAAIGAGMLFARHWRILAVVAAAAAVAIVLAVAGAAGSFWHADRRLRRAWEARHGRDGRRILLVHADHPAWREHFERRILPWLAPHAVSLDWSERGRWDADDLPVQVFQQWRPEHDFTPLALVIPDDGPVEVIPLWEAFDDLKHGRPEALAEVERHLRDAVERVA